MRRLTLFIKTSGLAVAAARRDFAAPAAHSRRCFLLACAVISAVMLCPCMGAQPTLGIQINAGYAAISVTGAAGTVCEIQYVNQLSSVNGWLCLTAVKSPFVYTDTPGLATGQRFYRTVEVAQPANTVFIPPGTFLMGSPTTEAERLADEGPQTTVTLTRGFFMGKYEVTQGEYLSLMNTNPSWFNGIRYSIDYGVDLSRPVEQVTWFDATNYCGKLTAQEQLAGRLPAGWVYRLPTEAEWEYACRAGTTTVFYFGNDLHSGGANFDGHYEYVGGIGTVSNPSGVYLASTVAVGSYPPNAWGLYDMAGNVWEMVQDYYGPYPGGSVTNPTGPTTGTLVVARGGSWFYHAVNCRSAKRDNRPPEPINYKYGLRVVMAMTPCQ